MKTVILLAAALLFSACGGRTWQFTPPATAENEAVQVSVHKAWWAEGKGKFRVWASLQNKTDQDLALHYGQMFLDHSGQEVPGHFLAGPVKLTKGFDLAPKMVKPASGPMEYLDVPGGLTAVKFVVKGITDKATGKAYPPVVVLVPLSAQ